MLKRNSQFTLIELIVVIVVLGILAAIVIPNISSFSKEARETQYTADARNVQTGYDMYTAKSVDLEAEAIQIADVDGNFDIAVDAFTVTNILNPEFDKDVDGSEKYVTIKAGVENHVFQADGTRYADQAALDAAVAAKEAASQKFALVNFDELNPDFLRKVPKYVDREVLINAGGLEFTDYSKKPVAAGVLLDAKGASTSVVQFVTGIEEVKGAKTGTTVVTTAQLAVIR